jgi:diguanylate cyclase (GGDEF)-like protein
LGSRWAVGDVATSGVSSEERATPPDKAGLLVLLDVLTSFSRTLLRDFHVAEILGDLVGRMSEILPVDGAGVMMEDEAGVLRFTAASDPVVRHIESLQIELGEGPCMTAYQSGEQVHLDDLSTCDLFPAFAPRALASGLHAVYSFPMWHDGQALGALDLYRGSPGTLTPTETAAGQTLADVATVYVVHGRERERARQEAEQDYQLAITDPLTGLANRRLLLDHLDSAVARSSRTGGTVAVFYLDLDNFKTVNDRLGHAAGDQVLTEVASRLRHAVRPGDTPARVGGDEFAVVCDELHDPTEARSVAERILAAMQPPIAIADSPVIVTSSIGLATGSGGNTDATTLLATADAALYVAKANGRNRIEPSDDR